VKKDFYFELADKFKASSSQTFLKILKFVIKGEKEARILLALPDNPQEVAKKLGRRESEIARKLKDLHMRGFTILEGISPSGPRYSLMNLGHFMDSVLFDPRYDKYGDEFFELWKTFCNQELLPAQKEDSSFNFRVLPLEVVKQDKRLYAGRSNWRCTEWLFGGEKLLVHQRWRLGGK